MESNGKIGKDTGSRGVDITPDIKARIKTLRERKNWTVDDLAYESGVSEKTIKKIESLSNVQKRYDGNTLKKLTAALGVTLSELSSSNDNAEEYVSASFSYYAKQFKEIDENLLPLIRDHKFAPRGVIEEQYYDYIDKHIQQRNISFKAFNDIFYTASLEDVFLNSIPTPELTVTIPKTLARITYSCSKTKQITVKKPLVMWDCHCGIPTPSSKKYECQIHSSPHGKDVHYNFVYGHVMFKYEGLKFYWKCEDPLWPPSIDSFYMLNTLEEEGVFEERYNSVLDMGSGTGFLGIMLASKNPNIKEVVLSDWLLLPYLYGVTNWHLNKSKYKHVNLKSELGIFTSKLNTNFNKHDLIVCNPPYLPVLDKFEELKLKTTVAGTDLLVDIIERCKIIGKKTYLQFSHLAIPEAESAAKNANVELKPVGKERKVPFRFPNTWVDSGYLSYLEQERGLIYDDSHRFPYWQKVQMYSIE